jgi:hypothetical protein
MKKIITVFTLLFLLNSVNVFSQEKTRSAKTGRCVSKEYAKNHKSTTNTLKTKSKK